METGRCPLCWARALYGVIEHLRRDHHRSEIEARTLLERSSQGSLGWNAEDRKKGACSPLVPVKRSQAGSVTDFYGSARVVGSRGQMIDMAQTSSACSGRLGGKSSKS